MAFCASNPPSRSDRATAFPHEWCREPVPRATYSTLAQTGRGAPADSMVGRVRQLMAAALLGIALVACSSPDAAPPATTATSSAATIGTTAGPSLATSSSTAVQTPTTAATATTGSAATGGAGEVVGLL